MLVMTAETAVISFWSVFHAPECYVDYVLSLATPLLKPLVM